MNQNLLERFCTPRHTTLSDFDSRVLSDSVKTQVIFEDHALDCYVWGEGKPVLLVHGWGSRASHFGLFARTLARSGYKAVAYDCPAHSSTKTPPKPTSNMFEYGRALCAIANAFGPLHAIVGHSFGALCAAFAAMGFQAFCSYQVLANKLILISSPPSLAAVLDNFCRNAGAPAVHLPDLKQCLEEGFDFQVGAYSLSDALVAATASKVLLVHDKQDEEFPIEGMRAVCRTVGVRLLETDGAGHYKTIATRSVISEATAFLDA